MIQIDGEKCVGCLRCLKVCPFTVLEERDGKASVVEGKGCLKCMHCAAVCPVEAITYGGEPAITRSVTKLPVGLTDSLLNLVQQRRSYRHFKERPVDPQVLADALEWASWAPSAKNQHPTKWIVVQSPDVLKDIMDKILRYVEETGNSPEILSEYRAGNNVVMGNANTILLAYARNNAINAPQDTAIAMTTVELILQSQGVGTCWGGYLARLMNAVPELKDYFPLPENNSYYGAFMLGYPQDEDYVAIPQRLKRADIQWK